METISFAKKQYLRTVTRALIIAILFTSVLGLASYHDTQYEERWPYPTATELATDYEAHVGEQTLLFGEVTEINDEQTLLQVFYEDGSFTMTVGTTQIDVQEGGFLQVYGTLAPDHAIVADRVVVVNPSADSSFYKYAFSSIGVVLVGVLFFRCWRVDIRTLTIKERRNG